MADQGRPNDCGKPLWQIRASRLIIEVIPPTRAPISIRLIINEPLEGKLGFLPPCVISRGLVQAQESTGQESHSFRRVTLLDPQQGTQIQDETTDTLL